MTGPSMACTTPQESPIEIQKSSKLWLGTIGQAFTDSLLASDLAPASWSRCLESSADRHEPMYFAHDLLKFLALAGVVLLVAWLVSLVSPGWAFLVLLVSVAGAAYAAPMKSSLLIAICTAALWFRLDGAERAKPKFFGVNQRRRHLLSCHLFNWGPNERLLQLLQPKRWLPARNGQILLGKPILLRGFA